MDFFEAVMMICFGASWPASIHKTWSSKNPAGKSMFFLWLVEIGYIAGIINKFYHPDWVAALYVVNAGMVAVDIFLVTKYRKMRKSTVGDA